MATLIYYLGWAKYKQVIGPARHLSKMLIDPLKNGNSHSPIWVKNYRKPSLMDNSSSDSDSYNSDTFVDETIFKSENNSLEMIKNGSKIVEKNLKDGMQLPKNIEIINKDHMLNENSLLQGEFLTDREINVFLRKIALFNSTNNIQILGLSDPIESEYRRQNQIANRFNQPFVEIFMSRRNHWVCVAGGMDTGDADIFLYDSMDRDTIDNQLGDMCSLILAPEILTKGYIIFDKKRTSRQKQNLCGYFALAHTMAICLGLNVENLAFDENEIRNHFIQIIYHEMEISMFPYSQ